MAVFRQAGANAVEVAKSDPRPAADDHSRAARVGSHHADLRPLAQRSCTSVTDVQETLFIAFVLVVIVIFVFLGRATDTLIPVVALPLSLLLTFIAMNGSWATAWTTSR